MFRIKISSFILILFCSQLSLNKLLALDSKAWILVDNFESSSSLEHWENIDTQNDTSPFVENPQITLIEKESQHNRYLLKKPAQDGLVGNRKAISYKRLPIDVELGETFTFYTRINIEYFPNNHSFGLSNLTADGIQIESYNAFEPMIRITDKQESDGSKNDGTLMVLSGHNKKYKKIKNPVTSKTASPLVVGLWYELWYVVNNSRRKDGGQRYDLYVKGGEFKNQQLVFAEADFRMRREQKLTYFMAICNTGSKRKPYGNGGVKYDDLYMSRGLSLTSPLD